MFFIKFRTNNVNTNSPGKILGFKRNERGLSVESGSIPCRVLEISGSSRDRLAHSWLPARAYCQSRQEVGVRVPYTVIEIRFGALFNVKKQ